MKVAPFASLDPASYREIVRRALAEDVRWGDVTTDAVVDAEHTATGAIVVRASCVMAGLDVAIECFRQLDPHVQVEAARREGEHCESGTELVRLRGGAAAMLTAERTALNFLQRLCGIATLTRDFVDAGSGRITVLDTRETTPTLRALEKYAVRVAGGVNHRAGLDDGVLIGANHVRLAGSVAEAVRRMRAMDADLPISVEVDTLEAVDAALARGDLEEAKRLAYVATTRARDGMVLLCPVSKRRKFPEEIQRLLESAKEAIPAQAQKREAVVLDGLLRFTHLPGLEAKPTSPPSEAFEIDEEAYKALWETRYAQARITLPSVLRRPSDPEHGNEAETVEAHHYGGTTDPGTAMRVGQLVHAYLEHYLLEDGLDQEKLSALRGETREAPSDGETLDSAARILSDFYAGTLTDRSNTALIDRVRAGTVLARELPVYLVHHDETWNGVIDLVLEEEGTIRAVDYKAAVARDPLPETYRHQEQIYSEALRRVFPEREIDFEFWWLGC